MGGLQATVLKHGTKFNTMEHQAQKQKQREDTVIFSYFSKSD